MLDRSPSRLERWISCASFATWGPADLFLPRVIALTQGGREECSYEDNVERITHFPSKKHWPDNETGPPPPVDPHGLTEREQ